MSMADLQKAAQALRGKGFSVACFETAREAAAYLDARSISAKALGRPEVWAERRALLGRIAAALGAG